MAHLRHAALMAVLAAGCGDPLLDDQFQGVPIWQFQGQLIQEQGSQLADADLQRLRIGLFFAPGAGQVDDPSSYVELASVARMDALSVSFTLNVFGPPAAALGAGGARYGIGRILAYADRDGDGRRGPGDPLGGMDVPTAFLYLPQSLAAGQGPLTNPLGAGFHELLLPQRCGKPAPGPPAPGDCGVPLGQACHADPDCGMGACLTQSGVPWPDGACVVPEPPRDGCRPADARYYPSQGPMGGPSGFYVKACQQDADCARPMDHIAGSYVCDPGLGACVPGNLSAVSLGTDVPTMPLCGQF